MYFVYLIEHQHGHCLQFNLKLLRSRIDITRPHVQSSFKRFPPTMLLQGVHRCNNQLGEFIVLRAAYVILLGLDRSAADH